MLMKPTATNTTNAPTDTDTKTKAAQMVYFSTLKKTTATIPIMSNARNRNPKLRKNKNVNGVNYLHMTPTARNTTNASDLASKFQEIAQKERFFTKRVENATGYGNHGSDAKPSFTKKIINKLSVMSYPQLF